MQILKFIFLGIIAIIAILLIVALFIKKEYTIEKSVLINKPKQDVFNYILFLKNQNNFSKWATLDSNTKYTYSGIDGTVGFINRWESDKKNVGVGEQEIKGITPNSRVDYEIRFIKPFEGKALAFISLDSVNENQTLVKWNLSSSMKYPMNLMLLFMNIEKAIGDDLSFGLNKLKNLLEK